MATTLENFSVELFYEIFIYFQLHEVLNIFSNLNSRITAIIENIPSISVYLGFHGMSIEVTNFYYQYILQANICTRLTSVCVSDTLSIDNGLWLAQHGSILINLRHLSLIDIKRSSFEMILNSLSPINSLTMFSVHFSAFDRAVCTFLGVPEGAYYERIFGLFPSLRICYLCFSRYIHYTIDSQFVLPIDRAFMSIQKRLLNLRSLTVRDCSPSFLSYLFEHLPQLEQFSCELLNTSWVPEQHPLRHDYNDQVTPINKRLAPNLRRLTMICAEMIVNVKSIEMLFEYDVLFSLTNFMLFGSITGPNVLHSLLSKLSSQCVYSFNVTWYVIGVVSLSDTSNILSNTFEQLKGPVPIELELSLKEKMSYIRAITLPRMDAYLCLYSYLHKDTVNGQSRWPYNKHALNSQLLHCNTIIMSDDDDQINDEFLSLSSSLVRWDRITSVTIAQPFNSTHLRVLFSQTINLQMLTLEYRSEYDYPVHLKEETFIELVNDISLCNILMSNGLRQLNLFTDLDQSNLINIAYLIVERLPHLQVLELNSGNDEVIQMLHIFINGLFKLNFLTLCGACQQGPLYEKKLRALCNSNTRCFRTEVSKNYDADTLFIWL